MALIESVIEKSFQDGTKYWLAIIDGKEVPCYDATIKDYKGKENPFQIALSAKGKEYLKVPKAGGFKGGGFQKGKSELEIKAQILTMSMAYAKDDHAKRMEIAGCLLADTELIATYRLMSQAILADLAKIQPEAPKTADKPPQSVPQDTSPEKTKEVQPEPESKGTLTIKEKLAKKMERYLQNLHSDTDENFQKLLIEITSFPDKDKETGKLTGKIKFCDNWDRLSDGWAKTAMGKMEKLIDEEERKAVAEMKDDDIGY